MSERAEASDALTHKCSWTHSEAQSARVNARRMKRLRVAVVGWHE